MKNSPGEDSLTIESNDIARMFCCFILSSRLSYPLRFKLGVEDSSRCIMGLSSYQVLGTGAEHFGAITIIAIAPANMPSHKSQNSTNNDQRKRTQNGSFAYFINSSLSMPESACLTAPMLILVSPFSEMNFTCDTRNFDCY